MGCGRSTLTHGVDSDENDVIIIKDDKVKENETEPAKLEVVEATTGNSLQDSRPNESNNKSVIKPNMAKRRLSRTIKSDTVGRDVENAWGASKVQKNVENVAVKPQGRIADDFDFESEYGRDGVDLSSSHVTDNYETDKLVNSSLGPRASPDGTKFNNYSEGVNRQQVLHKVESEETFDPSALVDIEKFKAANAPAKQQTLATNEDSELNVNEQDISANNTNSEEDEIVTTPSNYDEFYDDDEKELIASIENNFVTLPPPVLPGSVL